MNLYSVFSDNMEEQKPSESEKSKLGPERGDVVNTGPTTSAKVVVGCLLGAGIFIL